jgi:hypothetical protein
MKTAKMVFVVFCILSLTSISAVHAEEDKLSYIIQFCKLIDERKHVIRADDAYDYLLSSISRPDYSLQYGPIEIKLAEICADCRSMSAAVTFALQNDFQSDKIMIGPEGPWLDEQRIGEDQTVWLFYYEITTSADYIDNTFEWIQIDKEHWVQVDTCTRDRPDLPIIDNTWIDVTIKVDLTKIEGGRTEKHSCEFTLPYQVLPILDQCEYKGEALINNTNCKLASFNMLCTPIDVYFEGIVQEIIPRKESQPMYYDCFDDTGWRWGKHDYIEELPDRIYIEFYFINDYNRKERICIFTFQRERNEYVRIEDNER